MSSRGSGDVEAEAVVAGTGEHQRHRSGQLGVTICNRRTQPNATSTTSPPLRTTIRAQQEATKPAGRSALLQASTYLRTLQAIHFLVFFIVARLFVWLLGLAPGPVLRTAPFTFSSLHFFPPPYFQYATRASGPDAWAALHHASSLPAFQFSLQTLFQFCMTVWTY